MESSKRGACKRRKNNKKDSVWNGVEGCAAACKELVGTKETSSFAYKSASKVKLCRKKRTQQKRMAEGRKEKKKEETKTGEGSGGKLLLYLRALVFVFIGKTLFLFPLQSKTCSDLDE